MSRGGIDNYQAVYFIFGLLLLTVCPLLFPKIGEQQYSYVQGLCFLSLAWLALTFQMQKRKQAMVVRSMDVAMGVCLLALLVHIFWIKPVSLSVWRWVDAAGLLAFYVFVRLSSHREIRVLVACVMGGGVLQCLYAGMQGTGLLPSLQYHSQLTEEVEKYYDGNTFLVFNEYLRAVAETGFLLPLLFLLPVGIAWKYRNVSLESRMAACGIGCLLVFGCFSYPFSIFSLKVLAVLFLGIIGRESRVVYSWSLSKMLRFVVGGTAVACVAFSVYGLKIVSELDAYDRKDKEHVFWFRDNIAFVRRHCQGALERGDTIQAIRILSDAIGRIPVAGFYQHRAKLYVETGNHQKAEKDYLFLRKLVPTSWDIVLEFARLYHQMNRNQESLELLEPYTRISPKGKTLEQKALLLEIRELYQILATQKQ